MQCPHCSTELPSLHAREDQVLLEIYRIAALARDSATAAQRTTEALQAHFATRSIGVWLLDETRRQLVLAGVALADEVPPDVAPIIRLGFQSLPLDAELPAPRAVRTGTKIVQHAHDRDLDPRVREVLVAAGVEGFTALPFRHGDEWSGVAVVSMPAGHPLTDEEERLLQMALGHLTVAIENLRLQEREQLRQQETARSYRLAAVGELAAGVAHEVNNPLSAIANLAELLLEEDLSRSARDDISGILSEAHRAASIVRNLLAFARQQVPEKRPTEVAHVIRRVVELKRYQLRAAHIDVELHLEEVPLVNADAHQLQQVLHNLLSNARQAIQHAYDTGVVRVRLRALDHHVEIRVEDTGPGIPEHTLPHLFTPFFTTKKAGEGTGLGLSISYNIAHEHGGEIVAGNWGHAPVNGGARAEGGACFVVRLPIGAVEPAATSAAADAAPAPAAGPSSARPRALVVEDEPLLAASVERFLTRSGYDVAVSLRAEDALERLDRGEDFDVILSDLQMPGLGGEGLFRHLRERHPSLVDALVFTSGDIVSPETHEFLETSRRPAVAKPYELAHLREVLERVTQRRVLTRE